VTWIFKPDGTVEYHNGWPSPGDSFGIPPGSWAHNPNRNWLQNWAIAHKNGIEGCIWRFPNNMDEVPKELQAKLLLLE
jgi:hypothetical protein